MSNFYDVNLGMMFQHKEILALHSLSENDLIAFYRQDMDLNEGSVFVQDLYLTNKVILKVVFNSQKKMLKTLSIPISSINKNTIKCNYNSEKADNKFIFQLKDIEFNNKLDEIIQKPIRQENQHDFQKSYIHFLEELYKLLI